jgi:hypothetical protein
MNEQRVLRFNPENQRLLEKSDEVLARKIDSYIDYRESLKLKQQEEVVVPDSPLKESVIRPFDEECFGSPDCDFRLGEQMPAVQEKR